MKLQVDMRPHFGAFRDCEAMLESRKCQKPLVIEEDRVQGGEIHGVGISWTRNRAVSENSNSH